MACQHAAIHPACGLLGLSARHCLVVELKQRRRLRIGKGIKWAFVEKGSKERATGIYCNSSAGMCRAGTEWNELDKAQYHQLLFVRSLQKQIFVCLRRLFCYYRKNLSVFCGSSCADYNSDVDWQWEEKETWLRCTSLDTDWQKSNSLCPTKW